MIRRAFIRQTRSLLFNSQRDPNSALSRGYFPPIRISPVSYSVLAPRSYSTATETSSTGSADTDPPPPGTTNPGKTSEDPATKELEAKSREIIDLKDKYLRSVADFRNLQDRTKRDIDTARSFAITRFASDLIESVDNLDRALGTVDASSLPSSPDLASGSEKALNNLYQGLKMTDSILMQTLKKHGLERFDPSVGGEKFDPNLHDAQFMTKMEDKEDGTVFNTIQKGYILNGRVVRAAKVGVVKNS